MSTPVPPSPPVLAAPPGCCVSGPVCVTNWVAQCDGFSWLVNPFFSDCQENPVDCDTWIADPGGPDYNIKVCSATPCSLLDPPPYGCPFPGPGPTPSTPSAPCPPGNFCTTTWIAECIGGVWQVNAAPGSTQCLPDDAFGCNTWLPSGSTYTYLACSSTPCDSGGFPPYDCPFPGDAPGTTPTAEPCVACPPQANASGSGFSGICAANGNGVYTFQGCSYLSGPDHFIWQYSNPGGNSMSVEYNAGVWTVSVPLATNAVPSLTFDGTTVSGTVTADQFGFCGPAGTVVITFP